MRKIILTAVMMVLTSGGNAMAERKISYEEAVAIAEKEIDRLGKVDFQIETSRTQERPFGWVFFYAPAQYLRTGDVRYAVPGNGPLIVHFDGSTKYLPTSGHSDRVIEQYQEDYLKTYRP